MLQIGGSFHDWLGDGENLCLIKITDDATSARMLRFDARETIEAVCRRLWRWMKTHGVPKSVYADGRNMCHVPAGGRDNFFTAMCRRLGAGTIRAHSPQAKGRVERANGTHQARFVPLLQLDGVKDMDALNAYAAGYEA